MGLTSCHPDCLSSALDEPDKLNTVFRLRSEDADRQYNYRKEQRDAIRERLNTQEKNNLDALQKVDDREFELMRDSINNAQSLAKTAMENGQANLASQITALDPKSSTFSQDLASLQAQIKPKTEKLDTSVVEVGGRKLLVNNQTGATVRDLGESDVGGHSKIDTSVRTILRSGGLTEDKISYIDRGVRENGFDVVYEAEKNAGASEEQLAGLQKAYGVDKTEKFLDAEYLEKYYGDEQLKEDANRVGLRSFWSGWKVEKKAYIDYLLEQVALKRKAGMTDKEILKEM